MPELNVVNERMPCHISDMPDEEDEQIMSNAPREPETDEGRDTLIMASADEFAVALEAVKLSHHDIAKLTGVDRRTVWRWLNGRTPVPAYVWTILRDRKKIRELTLELCK